MKSAGIKTFPLLLSLTTPGKDFSMSSDYFLALDEECFLMSLESSFVATSVRPRDILFSTRASGLLIPST